MDIQCIHVAIDTIELQNEESKMPEGSIFLGLGGREFGLNFISAKTSLSKL